MNRALCTAAREIERGLVDARLGGFLFKKRIAKGHKGKSGGYRTIVAYRREDKVVFLFGFTKRERANLDAAELKALLALGDVYMAMDENGLSRAIKEGKLLEVDCDGEE